MKFALLFVAACLAIARAESRTVDCDFDERKPFCGWRREWFGMRKAGWKIGNQIRRFNLGDHTSGTGKFVYFLARSRPTGFQSRLRSSATSPETGNCLTFWLALGGTKQPFPFGNAVLNLYVVGEGSSVDGLTPVWNRTDGMSRVTGYQKVVVPLNNALQNIDAKKIEFVFEAIRGKSRKSLVAIDDVSLTTCRDSSGVDSVPDLKADEAEMKMKDLGRSLIDLMLPARRSEIEVMRFPESAIESTSTAINNFPVSPVRSSTGGFSSAGFRGYRDPDVVIRKPVRGKKRGKGRKGKKGKKHGARRPRLNKTLSGGVYLPGRSGSVYLHPVAPTSPTVLCDFMEYTQRLGRCFRDFFSTLQRRPRECAAQYLTLESCLRSAALSCVPEAYMEPSRVEEIILGALRDNLQTKNVFCKEDGAFVYPQFAVDKVPIQCSRRYFIKLSECSGSFSSMFHIQHGDPQLCRVYYKANQCQRQVTAEECNFDVETMLLYGLNLQYQIAHNPFCLNLSFSSWWPEY